MNPERAKYQKSGLLRSPPVVPVGKQAANLLLSRWHYLGAVHTASHWLGHGEGCTVWGVMRSRTWQTRLREAGFDPLELVRMAGIDGHQWATSSMLSQSIRWLLQNTGHDCFVTYADPMHAHSGAVYRSAGWIRLPQDSQPDGFTWRLDGRIVSRKKFFAELGTSALGTVRAKYGERVTLEPDVPKPRFALLKTPKRLPDFLAASRKVKTWGAARTLANQQLSATKKVEEISCATPGSC